jgi:hypothetical protein
MGESVTYRPAHFGFIAASARTTRHSPNHLQETYRSQTETPASRPRPDLAGTRIDFVFPR